MPEVEDEVGVEVSGEVGSCSKAFPACADPLASRSTSTHTHAHKYTHTHTYTQQSSRVFRVSIFYFHAVKTVARRSYCSVRRGERERERERQLQLHCKRASALPPLTRQHSLAFALPLPLPLSLYLSI